MKNDCFYPVLIKDINWSNFAVYGYTFVAHYCELEGIDITNDLVRNIELYVFYGTYIDKMKSYPIMRCLHYKTIGGRSRFGKYVKTNFTPFIEAVEKHPEWKEFFDDLGKGETPMDYLVLVEKGFRSFGADIHAMGTRALESKERWFAVERWRKREAYIAVVRHIRGHLTYPQWDCYRLDDYSERQALNQTFLVRHWPLTNGDNNLLDRELVDPPCWSNPTPESKPDLKRVKKERKRTRKSSVQAAVASASATSQVWDVEKNCFVPL